MSPSIVWLEQRLTEQRALGNIINVLHKPQLARARPNTVRGVAAGARHANQQPGEAGPEMPGA